MTRIIIIIIARCRSNPWLALNFFIIFFFFFFSNNLAFRFFFNAYIISIYRFVRLIRAYASMPRINVLTFLDFRSIALHFGRSYLSSLSFFLLLSHSLFSFILSFLDRQREWWSHFSFSSTYITTHFFFLFPTSIFLIIVLACIYIVYK